MALDAYMWLKGSTQGTIEGSVTRPGREGSIKVIAVNHEVISPTDPASGLPTGKRRHTPFTITKEVDRSSPLLMNALVSNEQIDELSVEFWRPSVTGKEEQFYTIELSNARIADIRFEMLNNQYPENAQHEIREHVSFTYQRITWTYTDGGITSTDDWEAPVV